MSWFPTGTGHELAIDDGRIVARNSKGKPLAKVPAAAKKTQAWEELDSLLSFLHAHESEVKEQVELWLLRSLPVPVQLLKEVWVDESWRRFLTDLVVSTPDGEAVGFLRSVTAQGVGIVDLDGETLTLDTPQVLLPHPVLLADLNDIREFAVELGVQQSVDQLFREVHLKPADLDPEARELSDWADGKFEQLRFAQARAAANGFKMSGGYAVCPCHDDGRLIVARYWVGSGYPEEETYTGELHWSVGDVVVPVNEVGPLAYSEGVRMAAHIFAGRAVEKEDER